MFKPGQSGNPKGRTPRRGFDDFLKENLLGNKGQRAKALVERLIGKAMTGDVQAAKLICERLGGKPKTELVAVSNDTQTLEQVRQQLAVLLAHPEVRKNVETLMQPPVEVSDTVQ